MLTMNCYKNREEWLEGRKSFIGGSDVACIMGYNPWKNNVKLWREKKGIELPDDLSDNEAVKYGQVAEEYIRALFALDHPELKVEYLPDNSYHNDEYPFAACSLDGWFTDEEGKKGILEIKTSNIVSVSQSNKWKNKIPDNYYCQVLYYLGITGWDYAILRANLKYKREGQELYVATREYRIDRSEVEEDIALILEKASEFSKYLEGDVEPPMIFNL